MEGGDLESSGSSPWQDIIIGSFLVVCFVVGLLGNVSALAYFLSNKRKSLPDKLYIIVVSVDIGTCCATIPVIISLFNNREAKLFENSILCGSFTIAAYFFLRISMYLVAVMSVTRTIAIIKPHRARTSCTLKRIVIVIASYSFFLLFVDAAFFALGWINATYYRTLRSYCSYKITEKSPKWALVLFYTAFEIEIFIPSVIVFISFVAGTITLTKNASTSVDKIRSSLSSSGRERLSLRKASIMSTSDGEAISRQVSITISLFTAVFLVCNIPLFVYQLIYSLSKFLPSVQEMLDNQEFNKKYSHLLCLVLPYVLNAAVNPCLYLFRMPRYRDEFLSWGRKLKRRVKRIFYR